MEKNVMQNTRNTVNAISMNRKDLHIINMQKTPNAKDVLKSGGLSMIEGNKPHLETKTVAQKWSNNVHTLSTDVKN